MKLLRQITAWIIVSSCLLSVSIAPVAHGACGDERFLTMPAWYRNVSQPGQDGRCEISVNYAKGASNKAYGGMTGTFVMTVALNIVEIMLHLVAYTTIAFIIVGGFKYLLSNGSPDANISGRKTIINALIGLVLSVASIGVVNFIVGRL
jgi:hypothetical protein